MTNNNYSINGLKKLIDDLETLATCLSGMPQEYVNKEAYNRLLEDQFNMIQEVNSYCNMLNSLQS
ncbi:hypothetical protein FCV43_16430 [Vibrio genomosp. F6]|uniref:hypothetical protein n=1 Tax=Vibrio genomosp. F6 TaxID=723172 RepID=UPI0010BD7B8A|nr:hypothetical protein [Vibrio genomosp. F6]TKF18581.1 hypothetical protein FCV43_16430 [Vibrio genomosp. F6]